MKIIQMYGATKTVYYFGLTLEVPDWVAYIAVDSCGNLFGFDDENTPWKTKDDLWDSDVHIIKPFNLPNHWKIYRSFDYGTAKPFSVGFWAVSDGCDVELSDGREISTVRGDIFRIAEWYGCDPDKPNTGLRLLHSEISKGIIEMEIKMGLYGRILPGPADNSIWNVDNGNSPASNMQKPVRLDNGRVVPGITWNRSDKAAGSRPVGWENVRKFLAGSLKPKDGVREHPGMFIFNNCKDFIEIFPTSARSSKDPNDLDSAIEDHLQDECRYFVLSTATGARSGKTVGLS